MARDQLEHRQFEEAVRQIARLLWVEAALGGSVELEGRERDGVFETRDTIHVVEATVSTKRDKADGDAKKTAQAVQRIRGAGGRFGQGWLITKEEPTVEQRKAVEKYSHSVRVLSFEQFRSMLFNGAEYIRCRSNSSFGSIGDPLDPSAKIDRKAYVPIDLLSSNGPTLTHDDVVARISSTEPFRCLIVGDFGAGKSMTCREIFFGLADIYKQYGSARTPIYINLREHRGQTDPVEALERHARSIGYSSGASDLVRAWRAGHVDLILDGFDEIATSGWGQSLRRVREHRYAAMALVRNFISASHKTANILVAGRSNFFDSSAEMNRALGIRETWTRLSLNDFTPSQIRSLLAKLGYEHDVPDWLPSRPLIVAYFALIGRSDDIHFDLGGLTAGAGWDKFLALISEREARQDERLDPDTVRHIIERLATKARSTADGMGRLSIDSVQDAYREIVGSLPDEGGQQMLLRLPGLAASSAEDGTRSFIDAQFASAARAGDVFRFIKQPFSETSMFSDVQSAIGESGRDVLQNYRDMGRITKGDFKASFESLKAKDHPNQLAMDIVVTTLTSSDSEVIGNFAVRGAVEDELLLGESDNSELCFSECLISKVVVEDNSNRAFLPKFDNCVIGAIEGLSFKEGIPSQFASSDVEVTDSGTRTNSDIMDLQTAEPVKVLLTVLRKLFLQKGGGRVESAFYRGLDARAAKFVPEVLNLIYKESLATHSKRGGNEVWQPNRAHAGRVKKILSAPLLSDDALIVQARAL